jgi:6-phosphogluconolactonase
MAQLTIAEDQEAVAIASAERLTSLVEAAIADRGSAVVSLTGGSTPERLYTLLADAAHPWRRRIDWARVHLFWGDERHVPPDHHDSNFGMANRALVAHVPVPPAQVHRMRGEIADARDAAQDYEVTLERGFAAAGRADRTFDLMLLGLGEDAHIASVFPGSPLLEDIDARLTAGPPQQADASPLVAGVWAPHLDAWRITLTPAAILDSRQFMMVVAGASKAAAVHAALEAPSDVRHKPAQLLRRAGDRVSWLIDRPAAGRLRGAPPS